MLARRRADGCRTYRIDERCAYMFRLARTSFTRSFGLLPLAGHDAVRVVHTVDRLDRAHDGVEMARVSELEVEAHARDAVAAGMRRARHDVHVMVGQRVRHV